MDYLIRALIGATIAVLLSVAAKTHNYFIAGLIPLFPAFAIFAHIIVGQERSTSELKETVVFGILSLLAYLGYLAVVWILLHKKTSLFQAIGYGTACWFIIASSLILCWKR